MNKLHVIVVAYHRPVPLRILIDSFIVQTCPDWVMTIIHDGPAPESVKAIIKQYNDSRISFIDSDAESGNHGFYIRQSITGMLSEEKANFVLHTNDDNYYVPLFVEFMLRQINDETGIVFCDTIHSHQEYNLQHTDLKVSSIDIGAFIVRLSIAKEVGFTHNTYAFDGYYAEECRDYCLNKGFTSLHILKPLFIHN